MKQIITPLFLAVAFLMTPFALVGAASAEQTYCQQKGHGAYGCALVSGKGYCKKNKNSGTGYVCSEDKPVEEATRVRENTRAVPVRR